MVTALILLFQQLYLAFGTEDRNLLLSETATALKFSPFETNRNSLLISDSSSVEIFTSTATHITRHDLLKEPILTESTFKNIQEILPNDLNSTVVKSEINVMKYQSDINLEGVNTGYQTGSPWNNARGSGNYSFASLYSGPTLGSNMYTKWSFATQSNVSSPHQSAQKELFMFHTIMHLCRLF
jgi:hypothetical protein